MAALLLLLLLLVMMMAGAAVVRAQTTSDFGFTFTAGPYDFKQKLVVSPGEMTVHWRFVNSTSRLNFALEGDTPGYMALGFGVAPSMGSGDAIICSLPGGVATVVDYRILGLGSVGVDTASGGTDDVIAGFSGSSAAGGNRLFEFSRSLTTSDANDYQFDPSGGPTVPIVLAAGSSDLIIGNQHTGRTRANVGFFADPNLCASPCGLGTCVAQVCQCIANAAVVAGPCVCNAGFNEVNGACVAVTTIDSGLEYTASTETEDGNMKLEWLIEDDEITVKVTSQASGWVAMGLGEKMADLDVYQASVTAGALDGSTSSQSAPTADAEDNILAATVKSSGGETTFEFKRKMDTGDSKDKEIPTEKGTKSPVALSYATTDTLTTKHVNRYQIEVDFAAGTAEGTVDLRVVHGVMMALSWGLFVPVGIMMALFKSIGHAWFITHTALLSVAILMTIIALIIICVQVGGLFITTDPLALIHSILGFAICIVAPFQIGLGFLADHLWDESRIGQPTPIWPDQIHWWQGRILFVTSFITILLGIATITEGAPDQGARIGGIIAVIVTTIIAIVVYVVRKCQEADH